MIRLYRWLVAFILYGYATNPIKPRYTIYTDPFTRQEYFHYSPNYSWHVGKQAMLDEHTRLHAIMDSLGIPRNDNVRQPYLERFHQAPSAQTQTPQTIQNHKGELVALEHPVSFYSILPVQHSAGFNTKHYRTVKVKPGETAFQALYYTILPDGNWFARCRNTKNGGDCTLWRSQLRMRQEDCREVA